MSNYLFLNLNNYNNDLLLRQSRGCLENSEKIMQVRPLCTAFGLKPPK